MTYLLLPKDVFYNVKKYQEPIEADELRVEPGDTIKFLNTILIAGILGTINELMKRVLSL
jgi:hypothetical protein